MSLHIDAKEGEIAPRVIIPGDPLRAKLIANTYLDEMKIISTIRGNVAYTGYYKGVLITVISSGMGIPSMGIYAYELIHKYHVKNIIRVGSCGCYKRELDLFDIVLATSSYSSSPFAYEAFGYKEHIMYPAKELNDNIKETALKSNIKLYEGNVVSGEVFDAYLNDFKEYYTNIKEKCDPIAAEMESYALFATGQKFGCNTACLLTVSDVVGSDKVATAEEREHGFIKMIELALNSIIKE